MTEFVKDPQFGDIVDFEAMRSILKAAGDRLLPDFNLLAAWSYGSDVYDDQPSFMTAASASLLAWMMLLAGEELELAEELKTSIFSLAWTEEHAGSDLLSSKTFATPISDDPDERQYHVKGNKWLINNSYHADYHMVIAKIDPEQDGPRSLSLFMVPRSSTKNWERLEAHVLRNMVLTKFDIDGPGTLIGKKGHGISIVQRMAQPSKYQCAYIGMRRVGKSVSATIDHLSTKTIFKEQPVNFSNVFRQLYNLVLQTAFITFMFHRAMVFSDSSFLGFHGTILKSFMLLRVNEVLSQNLLVAGSKGFTKESIIGQDAFDSFVWPVFDGHYTINTFMTTKHIPRYLNAMQKSDMDARINQMRQKMFVAEAGNQINLKPSDIRRPDFFDITDYFEQLNIPLEINIGQVVQQMRDLMAELGDTGLSAEPEYRYKSGVLLQWLESVLAAAEFWKVMDDDRYLNIIVQQYNGFVKALNDVISEGALQTAFLTPMRHVPLPEVEDNEAYLRDLLDIESKIEAMRQPAAGD